MFLDKETFASVIKNTPLISIDLIVLNGEGKILLGKRVNEPAKAYWFVPGGRVFKDETLDDAFTRTTQTELGIEVQRKDAKFHGTYEHFYKNNVFDDTFSTHYIVLAHEIKIDAEFMLNNQHEEYKWFSKEELLKSETVHQYTKDYFDGELK